MKHDYGSSILLKKKENTATELSLSQSRTMHRHINNVITIPPITVPQAALVSLYTGRSPQSDIIATISFEDIYALYFYSNAYLHHSLSVALYFTILSHIIIRYADRIPEARSPRRKAGFSVT